MRANKQEILVKCLSEFMHSINEVSNGTLTIPEAIYRAMDEYAKQQAIAFARFININYDQHGDNYVSKKITDNEVYFTDELYSKFIEQQNKEQ